MEWNAHNVTRCTLCTPVHRVIICMNDIEWLDLICLFYSVVQVVMVKIHLNSLKFQRIWEYREKKNRNKRNKDKIRNWTYTNICTLTHAHAHAHILHIHQKATNVLNLISLQAQFKSYSIISTTLISNIWYIWNVSYANDAPNWIDYYYFCIQCFENKYDSEWANQTNWKETNRFSSTLFFALIIILIAKIFQNTRIILFFI